MRINQTTGQSSIAGQTLTTYSATFSYSALSFLILAGLFAAGCGGHVLSPGVEGPSFSGYVGTPTDPIPHATIRLYAASEQSGTASTALLSDKVLSDDDGKFAISEHYKCPSANTQVYLIATDDASAAESTPHADATLIAALGACSATGQLANIRINELTTVASVSALTPFMESSASISAGTAEGRSVEQAFTTAWALSSILQALNADTSTADINQPESIQKLITLANIVSVCSSTSGGVSAGSACGSFLSLTNTQSDIAPKDTIDAVLSIFRNPNHNVAQIYALNPSGGPYKPALDSAPADWSITFTNAAPAPVFSPAPGSYNGPQAITVTDTDSSAWIFYNVGGSWQKYTGAFTVSSSATVQAVALASGVSALSTGTYTINRQAISVATLGSVTVGQTGTGTISLGAAAPQGGTVVSLATSAAGVASVSPSSLTVAQGQKSGTFSYLGVSSGSATLSAVAAGFTPGSAQVNVVAPVSVSVTPATVSLAASQSQAFTATVANNANTSITWTVSPAVGTISAAGLYTAPGSVSATQTITLKATSNADTTKSASAIVTLIPAVAINVSVAPTSVSLAPSANQQFTATVSGTSSTSVTWTVSGSGCVGTACGTVSSTGLYTAPAVTPSPAAVTVTATSQANASASATASVSITAPSTGQTYYLSATGNDGNSGLSSSSPWLSPNHPLNCGDVILAAAGTNYSATNFYTGKWGTVTCAAGNNVAWLKCAAFDACKISTSTNQGMWVDKSYWGVQGWEITTTASDTYGTCFIAQPNYSTPQNIHHIIFANDVANGCSQAGFASTPNVNSLKGVDYLVILGNVAYNAATGSGTCASGISVWEPVQWDSVAGTHIYIAGNFSYGNLDPSRCNGTSPTDGEGIIFDTFDGSQTSGLSPYTAQAVASNNILVGNGGKGLEVYNNQVGSSHASIYLTQNTTWGDLADPNQVWLGCGELSIDAASDVQVYGNLFSTNSTTGCGGHPIYAMSVAQADSSDSITTNFAYGYSGNNTFLYDSGSFAFSSSNSLGTAPSFSNPSIPGAPSCGSSSNVPACMASLIANFTPQASSAGVMGYHLPGTTPTYDPLFPKWLCSVTLPSGLVTMGCASE